MEEVKRYFDEKMLIIKKEDQDRCIGKIPILIWSTNELRFIKMNGEMLSISLEQWEKMLEDQIYRRTLSEFVQYLEKNFFVNNTNVITNEARRGVFALLEAVNSEI